MSLTDLLIVVPPILGLVWSAKECIYLRGVKLDGHKSLLMKSDQLGENTAQILKSMTEIATYI
jgi:hypothetical protein